MRGFETSEHQPLVNPDDWSRQGPVVSRPPVFARQVGDLRAGAKLPTDRYGRPSDQSTQQSRTFTTVGF